MRKISALFAVIVLALFAGSISFAQDHAKPMTNDDVVAMVKAGLPDDTIINAIHAQETSFDNSAMALVNLKKQGVSPKVMDAMLAVPSKHHDSVATPAAVSDPAASENARPPASGDGKAAAGTQTYGTPAAGRGKSGSSTTGQGSGSSSGGFFGKLHKFQDQLNGTVQQTQGTIQQAQGNVQQTQGTIQQAKGNIQQTQGTVQSQGEQLSAPGQPAAPAHTTSQNPAIAQANTVQARTARQNASAQQQMANRKAQAAKNATCKQQAAKAHPEGGVNLVNAYMSCIKAK